MFNFKRAASALVTLLAFTGIIVGIALIGSSAITSNLNHTAIGAATLMIAASIAAGLD